MDDDERRLLRDLLTRQRVLSLSVLVDGKPHAGLLPFVVQPDLCAALVHASDLARHSRGLQTGAPFAALIHLPDRPDADPLQLPRVSLEGTVAVLDRGTPAYQAGRELYLARFPASAVTFGLGDFRLYELRFERGRLVAGFARARTVTAAILRDLATT
jgi:heme oxygenase (biliverdin-IX-beta and delta-forming)